MQTSYPYPRFSVQARGDRAWGRGYHGHPSCQGSDCVFTDGFIPAACPGVLMASSPRRSTWSKGGDGGGNGQPAGGTSGLTVDPPKGAATLGRTPSALRRGGAGGSPSARRKEVELVRYTPAAKGDGVSLADTFELLNPQEIELDIPGTSEYNYTAVISEWAKNCSMYSVLMSYSKL